MANTFRDNRKPAEKSLGMTPGAPVFFVLAGQIHWLLIFSDEARLSFRNAVEKLAFNGDHGVGFRL